MMNPLTLTRPSARRPASVFLAVCLTAAVSPCARPAADEYPAHPDSQVQAGVPVGDLIKFTLEQSRIFPGTSREVTVYVPKQYNPDKPACVYVNQDGVQWDAPVVFDNLIARGELPVIIGVFVRPGVVKPLSNATVPRFNRSFEYDGLGDAYARHLLDEVFPAVEERSAPDGRPIRLSKSGNDRAIGGSSSGAIAAFTAAWERPDAFTRVFSSVGTYVGLRGGDRYATLVRKTEPKPIRIYMVDGSNDLNIYGGDWWMANQTLERALMFSGYDVSHVWGEGGHNRKFGTYLFPDAIRWLWRNWPEPVRPAGPTKNAVLQEILIPGEDWHLVGEGFKWAEGPAVDAKGRVFFTDIPSSRIYRITTEGKPEVFVEKSRRAAGQHFGNDGRLYVVCRDDKQIVAYDAGGRSEVVASDILGNDLVVAHNGNIYVSVPPVTDKESSQVILIRPDGSKQVVDKGVRSANGVTLSPDQSLLYVNDFRSHWVYSFQVQPDGTLASGQRYCWLHVPDTEDQSFADGIRCDREGRIYVATRMGIQICDQAGRVNAILPTPNGRLSHLVFGGEGFNILYATCGDKVYRRKVNTQGANAWAAPVKPPPPRL